MIRAIRVVILAAALALAGTPSASATFPGTNGRIAFARSNSIYTVNPDGSDLRRVTAGSMDREPDWSPDGLSLAFARDTGAENPPGFALWSVRADGTDLRRLTPDPMDGDHFLPHFTPDGERVVFENCAGFDCDGGIYSVGSDGTGLTAITPFSGQSYNWPVPSPNGKRIAFMRWHVRGEMMRIYLVRSDGTGPEKPITPIRLEGWAPDWAPDGKSILFSSNNYGNRPNGALFTVRANGHGLKRLTKPSFPTDDSEAAYSPDGGSIVFVSTRRAKRLQHTDLFIMRADGTHIHRLPLPFRDAFNPRWGPAPG